ncbi:MAG TPA: hypothetical protein VGE15_07520, partial [Sphingobacteriaceae bacterium]
RRRFRLTADELFYLLRYRHGCSFKGLKFPLSSRNSGSYANAAPGICHPEIHRPNAELKGGRS